MYSLITQGVSAKVNARAQVSVTCRQHVHPLSKTHQDYQDRTAAQAIHVVHTAATFLVSSFDKISNFDSVTY